MKKKVVKLGIKKVKGRTYYVRIADRASNTSDACEKRGDNVNVLATFVLKRAPNTLYYVDADGDVSSSSRSKAAKKTAPKAKKQVKALNKPKHTEIALAFDRSQSMACIAKAAERMFNTVIDCVKGNPSTPEHTVNLTIWWFGERVTREFCGPASLAPSVQRFMPNEGSTRLFDTIGEIISYFSSVERVKPGASFIFNVITDGGENDSQQYSSDHVNMLMSRNQATDRHTMTFMLPKGHKRNFCMTFGVPDGNVEEWEQSERGSQVAATQTQAGFNNYFTSRAAGQTATRSFYSTDASNIKKSDLKKLNEINGEVRVLTASVEETLREFCERVTRSPMLRGSAFYQLTKPEKNVQAYKKIVIREKTTGKIYGGDDARTMLGLPLVGDVPVRPGNHANFDVFIQSTSVNRKIPRGTSVIYWKAVGTPYTEGQSAS